ncbi:MAG: hypothetical protein WBA57_00770 [Elainellaceae cyanobacterium]
MAAIAADKQHIIKQHIDYGWGVSGWKRVPLTGDRQSSSDFGLLGQESG